MTKLIVFLGLWIGVSLSACKWSNEDNQYPEINIYIVERSDGYSIRTQTIPGVKPYGFKGSNINYGNLQYLADTTYIVNTENLFVTIAWNKGLLDSEHPYMLIDGNLRLSLIDLPGGLVLIDEDKSVIEKHELPVGLSPGKYWLRVATNGNAESSLNR